MLKTLQNFINNSSAKNIASLINPKIFTYDQLPIPIYSVFHYLDLESDNHFPTTEYYAINNISINKRIPIYHIEDLVRKEMVTTLANKKYQAEIKRWNIENKRYFRYVNLLETPNRDRSVFSIFNYNIIKDLYNYRENLLTNHERYLNILSTYAYYIIENCEKDSESMNIIDLYIPNTIPSFNTLRILLKLNTIKYNRVLKNNYKLRHLIEWYKWLTPENRENSVYKELTIDHSARVAIFIHYKGYVSALPLQKFMSVSKEFMNLEGPVKLDSIKFQKLFLVHLLKVQEVINNIVNSEEANKDKVEEEPDENEYEDDYEDEEKAIEISGVINKVESKPQLVNKALIDKEVDFKVETDDLESILKETEETNDDVLEEEILKAEDEKEAQEETEIILQKSEEEIEKILNGESFEEEINQYLERAKKFDLLTSHEIRSIKKLYEKRKELKSPYDLTQNLDDFSQIDEKDIVFSEEDYKIDASLPSFIKLEDREDKILKFDRKYIKHVMKKDIIRSVKKLEDTGVIIKEYKIDVERTAMGNYETHRLTIKPLDGKESTIYFRLPEIDEEGEMVVAGIKVRMRKQRTDLPIRKISPTRIALTSNYSKLFIFQTERKAYSENIYLIDYIKKSYLNSEGVVKKLVPGSVFDNKKKNPYFYQLLSMYFKEIYTDQYTLFLDRNKLMNYIKEEEIEQIEKKGFVPIGYINSNKEILVMDQNNIIYNYTTNTEIGSIYEIFEIDKSKIPPTFSMIKILGDDIPLGVVLAYYMGLNNLIAVTKTKYELLPRNKQYQAKENEVVLKFSDHKLILKPNKEHKLLFNGFLFFKDFIKENEFNYFNSKDIYLNMLETRGFNLLHLKELDLLEKLFLDPITVDILRQMNEPTTYFKLLLRANELLTTLDYPDVNDPTYSRIRGYDRVPGLTYRTLAESIRNYKFKRGKSGKIELDPYAVWNAVTRDNTVKISEDLNPILDVKEMEVATFTGAEGLSKDAIPEELRRYHKNDIGLISEATVDSSDVGVNFYLSPFAKFKDIRGSVIPDNTEYLENKEKVFSTSALLAPFIEHDDPKRINFVNIQNGHTIASEGYMQPLVRTGYEYIMPYRVGKLYCVIAKDDGVVVNKTDKLLTVKYKDNTIEGIALGTKFGRMEGSIYLHEIVTELKKGDKFNKNDYLAYNKAFFERDWLDKSKLVLKMNRYVTTALMMNNEVFEDSSAISKEFSRTMKTYIIKERKFIINFKQNIVNLLPIGTKVKPNDVLFTLVDENTDYNNLSESSLELLKTLANISPKAKAYGEIIRYEIKYNGELSDMSPTLRKIAKQLDNEVYEETKGTEYEITSNKVTSEYRSDGINLDVDTAEFKVFIKVELNMGIGDKGVFGNQMKSVVSEVISSDIYTESGERVDAMFSYKSIINRVVNSPILLGTTIRLIRKVSQLVAEKYFK